MPRKIIGVIVVLLVAFGIGYFISQSGGNPNDQPSRNTPQPTENPSLDGTTLDLSGQQLTEFPYEVLSQTDITVLNLSNNQLTGLPADITRLVNLREINIENNRLTSFPDEINQLTSLRKVLANNNRLETVSSGLTTMTWLETLDLSGNSIPNDEITRLETQLPDTQIKY